MPTRSSTQAHSALLSDSVFLQRQHLSALLSARATPVRSSMQPRAFFNISASPGINPNTTVQRTPKCRSFHNAQLTTRSSTTAHRHVQAPTHHQNTCKNFSTDRSFEPLTDHKNCIHVSLPQHRRLGRFLFSSQDGGWIKDPGPLRLPLEFQIHRGRGTPQL